MKTTVQRSVASLLIVSMTGLGMPLPAQAGTVSTEEAIAVKRDRIAAVLERSDVRAQLEAHGVSVPDAQARVAALTDQEVAQLAGRIDALPAGGDPISLILMLPVLAFAAVVMVGAAIFSIGKAITGAPGKRRKSPLATSVPSPRGRDRAAICSLSQRSGPEPPWTPIPA